MIVKRNALRLILGKRKIIQSYIKCCEFLDSLYHEVDASGGARMAFHFSDVYTFYEKMKNISFLLERIEFHSNNNEIDKDYRQKVILALRERGFEADGLRYLE